MSGRNVVGMLAVLLLAPAVSVEGQETTIPDRIDRFDLFTECAPVELVLSVFDDEDDPVGLTEDRVRTMAESRLRAARLYDAGLSDARLSLVVTVFRNVFLNAEIHKTRLDPFTGDALPTGRIPVPRGGRHGGGATAANFIMQLLTERVDALIGDYLRVNEGYC